MTILLSTVLIVAFLGMLSGQLGLKHNNYKGFLILSGILITLVAGLRDPYVGTTDNIYYWYLFQRLDLTGHFMDYYRALDTSVPIFLNEIAFSYCVWLLTRFFSNPQILFVVSSGFITWSTFRFIHKNTANVPMAVLLYLCLGLFTFNMNGMRQALAMAICLWAFEHAKNRKLLPFLLTVFLAMQFHKTAFIFFPVYLFPIVKNKPGHMLLFSFAVIIFSLALSRLIPLYDSLTGESFTDSDSVESGGIFSVLIYLAAVGLAILKWREIQTDHLPLIFLGVVFGFALYLSRYVTIGIMERVSFYYFYFLIILLPSTVSRFRAGERSVFFLLLSAFAIALFAYRLSGSLFADFTFCFL